MSEPQITEKLFRSQEVAPPFVAADSVDKLPIIPPKSIQQPQYCRVANGYILIAPLVAEPVTGLYRNSQEAASPDVRREAFDRFGQAIVDIGRNLNQTFNRPSGTLPERQAADSSRQDTLTTWTRALSSAIDSPDPALADMSIKYTVGFLKAVEPAPMNLSYTFPPELAATLNQKMEAASAKGRNISALKDVVPTPVSLPVLEKVAA